MYKCFEFFSNRVQFYFNGEMATKGVPNFEGLSFHLWEHGGGVREYGRREGLVYFGNFSGIYFRYKNSHCPVNTGNYSMKIFSTHKNTFSIPSSASS